MKKILRLLNLSSITKSCYETCESYGRFDKQTLWKNFIITLDDKFSNLTIQTL